MDSETIECPCDVDTQSIVNESENLRTQPPSIWKYGFEIYKGSRNSLNLLNQHK